MKFIPYGRQNITAEDIAAVVEALKSDFLTQGPAIEVFEQAVCAETGAQYAVACSNGTAALHLAAIAAQIEPGDRVVVPPITFVASANCARYRGAEVLFADIDPATITMSPLACRKILERCAAEGRPVKAVVTVDMAGHPCDMQAFALLKKEFNFVWIQDACHSIGSSWEDNLGIRWKTGEFPEADMTVFSFHPVKHITCGEGGMITTHSEAFAKNLRLHRSHGIMRTADGFSNREEAFAPDGSVNPWYYEMQSLGFNYRLTDIQAALGTSQLQRLAAGIVQRQTIAAAYRSRLASQPFISFPAVADGVSHAYHLVVAQIDFMASGRSRAEVMNSLKADGIGTQVHYIPVPMMPYYACSVASDEINASLAYYRQALSLPCFPQMSDEDIDRVCDAMRKALA
ncbi:MAG: UDP-4-amino-4,6-dideoxy-N-acetyl-beta-L-altrosamine transaminase [Candidatus Riflebacteria bacterium]|nr:UDP-4-amino-4,6-dideoxy-N-acetyl-beta-L-altrosamine transaminase [Candidatus Riflebacteria bacterium]